MKSVTLRINDQTVQAMPGTTILQAAESAGIKIPTLCNKDGLEPYGACRMCMVEIEQKGWKKLVASCLFTVEEGLIVQTNTEQVLKVRKMIVELLWPASSQFAAQFGVTSSRFSPKLTECNLCGLCVRHCAQKKGGQRVMLKGRGINREPALLDDTTSSCASCRECFGLCSGGWIVTHG